MTIDELIERVEKATGRDRQLDFAIGNWLGLTCYSIDMPAYTSSLDAVVALIEREMPGAKWTVSNYCGAFVHLANGDMYSATGKRGTLAPLLAFLRAKKALPND